MLHLFSIFQPKPDIELIARVCVVSGTAALEVHAPQEDSKQRQLLTFYELHAIRDMDLKYVHFTWRDLPVKLWRTTKTMPLFELLKTLRLDAYHSDKANLEDFGLRGIVTLIGQ